MSGAVFDTLKYSKELEQGGFTREQAEVAARAQKQSLTEVFEDIARKSEVDALIKDSNAYKSDIAAIKTDLAVLKWMVGTVVVGILTLLIKAFFV